MEDLLLRMLTLSAACSAVLLPLLLLARRIRHRYAARTLYVLFLLLALRLVLPVQLSWSVPAVTVEVPTYSISAPVQRPARVQNMTPTGQTASGQTAQTPAQSLPQQVQTAPESAPVTIRSTQLLSILWLAGGVVFLLFHCVSYLLARRKLLRSALSPTHEQADKCSALRQELNIRRSVGLMRSAAVRSPMMLGLVRPVILLPDRGLRDSELDLTLRHELLHLKRQDVAYKAVMLLANAVHWFNPLVWWMAREAGRNLELCCDEAVIRSLNGGGRREYGQVLLQAAADASGPALSTRFGSGKGQLKDRLGNLFLKKRRGVPLLCCALALVLALGGLVACEQAEGGQPSPQTTAENTLTAREALDALKESISFDPDTAALTFTVPAGYSPASDWSIHIAGRQEMDGESGMSLHYLDGTVWEAGETYTVPLTAAQIAAIRTQDEELLALHGLSSVTELTLDAALPDPENGEQSITVDLLPVVQTVANPSYTSEVWGFTLQLPENWAGLYEVDEGPDSWGFYVKNRGELGGWLFGLSVEDSDSFYAQWGDDPEHTAPQQIIILAERDGMVFYTTHPSDVRFTEENQGEYLPLEASVRDLTPQDFTLSGAPFPTRLTGQVASFSDSSLTFRASDGNERTYSLSDPDFPVNLFMHGFEHNPPFSYSAAMVSLEGRLNSGYTLYLDGDELVVGLTESAWQPITYSGYLWPVISHYQIARPFSQDHPGVDIIAVAAASACSGTVTEIGADPRYGTYIVVSCEEGSFRYANLSDLYVAVGDQVEPGNMLARLTDWGGEDRVLHLEWIPARTGQPEDPLSLTFVDEDNFPVNDRLTGFSVDDAVESFLAAEDGYEVVAAIPYDTGYLIMGSWTRDGEVGYVARVAWQNEDGTWRLSERGTCPPLMSPRVTAGVLRYDEDNALVFGFLGGSTWTDPNGPDVPFTTAEITVQAAGDLPYEVRTEAPANGWFALTVPAVALPVEDLLFSIDGGLSSFRYSDFFGDALSKE
ncbi:M56 family metallopeptidase [uncultured Pseudoflavonifractor sp.]|uniref:M56 family metallopeptidase n=1 Tax=uncultured Pseudoflavonifractor sp. TaxID=1221379 RepID=UPI0025F77228|nr:M56 family metallopeptidase [uncultured Pseudoflavonifractor sp.]